MAYGPDELVEHHESSLDCLEELLTRHRVTWLNMDGLGDAAMIRQLGERFGLHVLALEDVVHVHQRAKVEDYDDHLFLVVRMPEKLEISQDARENSGPAIGRVVTEQLAVFVGRNFVLTFQDGRPGDCLEPLRQRIRRARGRIRQVNAGGLAYAILDTVIDHYFPLVEQLAAALDDIDDDLIAGNADADVAGLHAIRRCLLQLRRTLRPHAEAAQQLMRGDSDLITDDTRLYLRDCHDHAMQLLDAIETCRETCTDLRDAYFSALSTHQNEVMKTLTIIATLFMPMGFIAGVYGMNFHGMPELNWTFGYPFALAMMASIAVGLLWWFYKRGWFGSS